jgi:hypothetical protein
MAKDRSGRPIPAYIPPPPDRNPQLPAAQEQFLIAAQKVDTVLAEATDLSVRVGDLERSLASDFNEALLDFEQRFDAMMLARMEELTRQVEMTLSAFQRGTPEPEPEPETR